MNIQYARLAFIGALCFIVGTLLGIVVGQKLSAKDYDYKIVRGKPIEIDGVTYQAEEVSRTVIIFVKKGEKGADTVKP